MRILKTAFSVISGILLAAAMTISAAAYNVTVRDDAGLFSADENAQITDKAESVSEQGSWNVLIITIEGDPGKSVRSFADDSYEAENGINANGVCIVLNPSNPDESESDVYLGTYGSAITLITDNRIHKFLDDCFPYYENYQDAKCVLTGLDTLSRFISEGVRDDQYTYEGEYNDDEGFSTVEVLVFGGIFGLIISVVTCCCIASSYKFHGTVSANAYLDNNNMNMYRSKDVFVKELHSRRKIESSSGGGGSSTHHTSGGGIAGGGGRSSSSR